MHAHEGQAAGLTSCVCMQAHIAQVADSAMQTRMSERASRARVATADAGQQSATQHAWVQPQTSAIAAGLSEVDGSTSGDSVSVTDSVVGLAEQLISDMMYARSPGNQIGTGAASPQTLALEQGRPLAASATAQTSAQDQPQRHEPGSQGSQTFQLRQLAQAAIQAASSKQDATSQASAQLPASAQLASAVQVSFAPAQQLQASTLAVSNVQTAAAQTQVLQPAMQLAAAGRHASAQAASQQPQDRQQAAAQTPAIAQGVPSQMQPQMPEAAVQAVHPGCDSSAQASQQIQPSLQIPWQASPGGQDLSAQTMRQALQLPAPAQPAFAATQAQVNEQPVSVNQTAGSAQTSQAAQARQHLTSVSQTAMQAGIDAQDAFGQTVHQPRHLQQAAGQTISSSDGLSVPPRPQMPSQSHPAPQATASQDTSAQTMAGLLQSLPTPAQSTSTPAVPQSPSAPQTAVAASQHAYQQLTAVETSAMAQSSSAQTQMVLRLPSQSADQTYSHAPLAASQSLEHRPVLHSATQAERLHALAPAQLLHRHAASQAAGSAADTTAQMQLPDPSLTQAAVHTPSESHDAASQVGAHMPGSRHAAASTYLLVEAFMRASSTCLDAYIFVWAMVDMMCMGRCRCMQPLRCLRQLGCRQLDPSQQSVMLPLTPAHSLTCGQLVRTY